ncbi:MAG: hypothetical protein HC836_27870 [Richelia sp. RM2_1_2]|nr:hypothetical protein [Richelia sp. RM2_1_2]
MMKCQKSPDCCNGAKFFPKKIFDKIPFARYIHTMENIAKQIEEAVEKRGTIIVSFGYNGKRRNVTVGAEIAPGFAKRKAPLAGGNVWGEKSGPRACIVYHKGAAFMRGFENTRPDGTSETVHRFKCFRIEKMTEIKGI